MIDHSGHRPAATGFWRGLYALVARLWGRHGDGQPAPAVQQPAPIIPLARTRELAPLLVVPAHGGVFDFTVGGTLRWRSEGLDQLGFDWWIRRHEPTVRLWLQRFAEECAKGLPPHRGQELERRLGERVAAVTPWRFPDIGTEFSCTADVRVRMDDRVRRVVEPIWERRIKMECEHEVALRRAELAEILSGRWTRVLDGLVHHPQAHAAAQLTEQGLADVVTALVDQRNAAEQRMHDVASEMAANPDKFDHFLRDQFMQAVIDTRRGRNGTVENTGNGPAPVR